MIESNYVNHDAQLEIKLIEDSLLHFGASNLTRSLQHFGHTSVFCEQMS